MTPEIQADPPLSSEPLQAYPAGVGSFDPTTGSVLLWTLSTQPGACTWELATDDRFSEVVAGGTAETTDNGTVSVTVDDLAAGRTYWYRFTAGGVTSPVGRTRTLPDARNGRMRIGVVCCARFGQARFEVYRALAAADLDVVVHLGDYIYEDTKYDDPDRAPVPDHDCVTLGDYRARHRQCREDPDLRLLHQRHPMVVVWDDHDVADNAHRAGAASHEEEEHGPWEERLNAALQAHHEYLPKRLADPGDLSTPWRTLDADGLVRLVCTETRAHRDPVAGEEGASPADDPDRTMLGEDQRRWLLDTLADPTPRWTMVLSGTVVSELTLSAPEALDGALPEKYAIVDGRATNTDQWDGYTVERQALAEAAGRRGGNTVILSGDIHSAWAIRGPSDGDGPVAIEFTCPPAATTPLGQLLPPGSGAVLAAAAIEQLPQVRWMDPDHRGFIELDVTDELVGVSYWWVDADQGDDPMRVELGRRFEVPAGPLPPRLVDPVPVQTPIVAVDDGPSRRKPLAIAAIGLAAALAGAAVLRCRRRAH